LPSCNGNNQHRDAFRFRQRDGRQPDDEQCLRYRCGGAASASQMIDDVMTKWLDVKVIDFINDNDNNDEYKKCILKGGTEKDCANI
jgi:hypothetical protein